jgi:hypothetical protein
LITTSVPIPAAARRGRLLLLIAAAVTLAGDLIVISAHIWLLGIPSSVGSIVRWFFTLALLIAIWRGYGWARWLFLALLTIALLMIWPVLVRGGLPLWINLCFGLEVLIAMVLLAVPNGVTSFMKYQRGRYRPAT